MRSRGLRPAAAAVGVLAGVGATALVLGVPTTASREAAPRSACAERLVTDWSDGRIDGTYPLRCYREALKSLPTDLRVYSSAHDDISQALSQRIVQGRAQKISGHQGETSVRKLESAR